ncbi:MAG: thioredoxin family protein [Planctomycetota bacterium]
MSPFFERFWPSAVSWTAYLDAVEEKADLWASYAKRARVHEDERARLEALPGARRILVLSEDWCGDAIRSVPTIVAMAEAVPGVEVKVLQSDDHPEALSERLTHGGRAIPIAVVFDENGEELGAWGPRPAPLQAELRKKLREGGSPSADDKGEFYAPIMAWYAKDGGRTVAQEVLMLLERGGAAR